MMRAIIVTIMCAVIATATNDFYQMKALVQSPNEYTPIISSFSELLFHGNLNKINATIIRRFRLIDTDSSGAISLQEFVLATRTVNYRVMRNNKLNISRDEYIQGPATDDERLIWEGMDTNNDNLVEFTEYMNSNMWALHLKITFNSETCYEFQARIDACGYSPLQMVPNSQPPLNVNQAASLVAAQCRTGLSALSNYDLENCVLKSSCERLPGCFTNRLRPQQAIVQSAFPVVPNNLHDPGVETVDYNLDAYTKSASRSDLVAVLIVDLALSAVIPLVLITIGIFAIIQMSVVLAAIVLFCLVFGTSNFLAAFSRFSVLRSYSDLHMPKLEYPQTLANITAVYLSSVDPKCEMFTYWPHSCHRTRPFKGIPTSQSSSVSSMDTGTVEGVPLDPDQCDRGGELWSGKGCKALSGAFLFDTYSLPCGPLRLNCRPLCYKATLESCADNYIYINSSVLMSRVIEERLKPIKQAMFDPTRPGNTQHWEVWDRRYVDTLGECLQICNSVVMQCQVFTVQVPTKFHSKMRCSLVRSVWPSRALSTDTTSISAGVNGKSPNLRVWPIKVNTVFDLVDEQGSLGKDGRPPQFVVGVRRR